MSKNIANELLKEMVKIRTKELIISKLIHKNPIQNLLFMGFIGISFGLFGFYVSYPFVKRLLKTFSKEIAKDLEKAIVKKAEYHFKAMGKTLLDKMEKQITNKVN